MLVWRPDMLPTYKENYRSFFLFKSAICQLVKIPWQYQNSAGKGKFCSSARNSMACLKLWALMITATATTTATDWCSRS